MSDTDDSQDQAPPPSAPVGDFRNTVDEFCLGLSARLSTPEIIYAFAQNEKRAGTVKDDPDAFQSRFDAFVNRPV